MTKTSRIVLVAAAAVCVLAAAAAVAALTARSAHAVPPAAAAGGVAISAEREGHAKRSILSPAARPASTPGRGSSAARPRGGPACVTSAGNGNCGPYGYRPISNSNGYTTYVANNMWGCGSGNCGPQTVTAYDPGDWSVKSAQASGNTAVLTYPDVQQVFTKTTNTDPPLSAFTSITSGFTETMNPQAGTDAEAAYDLWLSHTSGPNEVMIWVDNVGRGSGGAQRIGAATIAGQAFTVYQYQGGEVIFSLNQNEQSGTVDILAALKWLQGHGLASAGAQLGQVDFGFEICSTGGKPENFAVSRYTLTSACGPAGGCFG
jgi:Glycosyl hydrolase family 12